jgi:hypothetical protein
MKWVINPHISGHLCLQSRLSLSAKLAVKWRFFSHWLGILMLLRRTKYDRSVIYEISSQGTVMLPGLVGSPSEPEDVFARVPEVAAQADLVLKELDGLLDDDQLYPEVRADLGKRYRFTIVAWTAFDAGGSDPAHAAVQAPIWMEL